MSVRGYIIGMQYNLIPFKPKGKVPLYPILTKEGEEPQVNYIVNSKLGNITPFYLSLNGFVAACKESVLPVSDGVKDDNKSNIKISKDNDAEQYKKIERALSILKLLKPDLYKKIEDSKVPITILFEKLNEDKIYEKYKLEKTNNSNTFRFGTGEKYEIIYGKITVSEPLNYQYIKDIKYDNDGEPTGATLFRSPTIDEQTEKRNTLDNPTTYLPNDDLREVSLEEAEKEIKIINITIKIDPITNITNKEIAIVLAHELFGHAAYEIFNKALSSLWSNIEYSERKRTNGSTYPLSHFKYNPSGIQANNEEEYARKNYKKTNELYEKSIEN